MTPMALPEAVAMAQRLWPGLDMTAVEWGRLLSLFCGRPVSSVEAADAVHRYVKSDDARGELGVQDEGR